MMVVMMLMMMMQGANTRPVLAAAVTVAVWQSEGPSEVWARTLAV